MPHPPILHHFAAFIRSRVAIGDEELKAVLSAFTGLSIKKGAKLLRRGQVANQYYYIGTGGLRLYYGEFDEQHTSWVFFQDEFFAEISSLQPRLPTRFHIEAVEDTELLAIDRETMDALYRRYPAWQEFGRKVWEEMCIRQVDQNLAYQTLSARQMYEQLLRHPDFVQKIPVKQLASILGITPNALSRIRKEMR
ncbi:CRP-like cAMP-binding protein [Neolewinella xylanilytica]|uniref:CRP-like cAMP-binding protein n=1 Tax=Neolewinella xylanilytica TaxID=1514080 RepID=A0A2S6I7M5_9BACT|nr:Crp/Fnr family transcriptional regulator [Neolewinella xylanilytica]PPK87478.1 CRP-like cAMP-binding protein [Neolewinella xylanilytica]